MRFLTGFSRVFVGLLFIFSGLVKLNDPMGFSFKLHDYFAEGVLNLPFLDPITLPMAIFIVILEVLVGLGLLVGFKPKLNIWLLMLMIVFFTFLTFYSAYFNKVTDCGCFGDAIPLTPWQSFYKDLILLVFIIILFINRNLVKPISTLKVRSSVMVVALLACSFMAYDVLAHLPYKDFRAYKVGTNIPEGMIPVPDEAIMYYNLKNKETGEIKRFEKFPDDYTKEWEYIDFEKEIIKEGKDAPIHDFTIEVEGADITEEVLAMDRVFLVISYDITKANVKGHLKIREFANEAEEAGVKIIGLSGSVTNEIEKFRHEHQLAYPFGVTDGTALKTIIRANPGIIMLEEGVIKAKWHYNDLPEFKEVQANY